MVDHFGMFVGSSEPGVWPKQYGSGGIEAAITTLSTQNKVPGVSEGLCGPNRVCTERRRTARFGRTFSKKHP